MTGSIFHMFLKMNENLKWEVSQQSEVINQMKQNLQQVKEQIQALTVGLAGNSVLKCSNQQCQPTLIVESTSLLQASNEVIDASNAITHKTIDQAWAIPRDEVNYNGTRLNEGKWGYTVKTIYNGQVVAATFLSECVASIGNQKDFVDKMNQFASCHHHNLVEFIGAVSGTPAIIVVQFIDTTLQKALDECLE